MIHISINSFHSKALTVLYLGFPVFSKGILSVKLNKTRQGFFMLFDGMLAQIPQSGDHLNGKFVC